MPLTSYIPAFPYKGNQVIISSGRVLLHSKNDSIFLFGKRAVSVSTTGTFNIDANIGVTVAAPKIELGIEASVNGQPVIKGFDFKTQLDRLLYQIESLSEALSKLESSSTGLAKAVPLIVNQANLLKDISESVRGKLPSTFSNTTYTL